MGAKHPARKPPLNIQPITSMASQTNTK